MSDRTWDVSISASGPNGAFSRDDMVKVPESDHELQSSFVAELLVECLPCWDNVDPEDVFAMALGETVNGDGTHERALRDVLLAWRVLGRTDRRAFLVKLGEIARTAAIGINAEVTEAANGE